jgi:glycosyltransferase
MGFKCHIAMIHVLLFTEESPANTYGVGSYISQLTAALENKENLHLYLVRLHTNEKEFKYVHDSDSCESYVFPGIKQSTEKDFEHYYRAAWNILRTYIRPAGNDKLILHLNIHYEYPLIAISKEAFPDRKVIYTVHYQPWCFDLKGNAARFKEYLRLGKQKKIPAYQLERRLFAESDALVCLSCFTKSLLTSSYEVPEEKMFLVPNGLKDVSIPLSTEQKAGLKKRLSFRTKEKIILFAGRVDEIKGIGYLIIAFKKVLAEEPDCRLVIAGDGNFAPFLKLCDGFWKQITFTGQLAKERLYEFYKIADLGILPSFLEQCSYTAIEMMMFGLPMIASDTTGLAEMIEPEVSGLQIPVNEKDDVDMDADTLAGMMLRLLRNPDNARRLGTNARRRYEQMYTTEQMAYSMTKIYQDL